MKSANDQDINEHNACSSIFQIDRVEEAKVVKKIDRAITPILLVVYLSCFIDRSNIGNVKVAGLLDDIGATERQFSTAVSLFFVTYVPVEVPAVILVKRFEPRFVLTILCIIWSVTTIANGLIKNIGGLYACRLILGACEGGLFPSLNMYLTMVYKRNELAKRTSYLVSCTALSGAFGGLLAYGLLQMDGVGGYAGWRWVYIVEGAFSVLCAFAVWFGLPSDIRKAYFLNENERQLMEVRHQERLDYMGSDELDWQEIKLAFLDAKTWLSAWTQFCQNIFTNGFGTFLPSILRAMGHGTLAANYLTIPVYCLGALAFFTFAFLSDKYGKCGFFLFSTNILGAVGYAILIGVSNNAVKYFACFVCTIAVYNGTGLNLAWLNVNMAPQYRRATAIGIQQTIGNSAGAVAGQIYRSSPYLLGNIFSLGAIFVAEFLCNGKYEALSYTWGDPNDRTQIYLDDRPFSVTANLESALRCLRLPDTDRVLWTDSICINQKNVSEANIQVQRMWAIYKYSSRVVVFLGREAKGTTSIAGLLRRLTVDVLPKDYRAITSILQDKSEAASWKALDELMKRPWWSRAWIVQEFAVNREVVFICGAVEIPERIFGSALEILVDYSFNAIVPKPLQYFVRHIASTPISHLWTVRRAYQKHGLDERMRDPANMLYRFRGFKSFDPRDKVYSLFRLMDEDADLKPDYNKRVKELYKDVVRVSIKTSDTLQVLCHHNRTIQGIRGLPTWCPDWTVMRGRRILLWPNGYSAGGTGTASTRFDGNRLYLKGKLLSRVQWLEAFDSDMFSDNSVVFSRIKAIETEILSRSEALFAAGQKLWPSLDSFRATLVGS
ncbi:putative transporter [Colletotrichum siamense]|uniref:putative transporter n=1 Tax=Colletotrichum siamense TaxID=690259 RepID=UPI0018729588|nr:putative transporter [Colletotrichum siamense]KAF5510905.1 putative transporter [Colletotrichum siamense]